MPVRNRFAEMLPEITAWRRDLHENPEILFETHRTAGIVAEKLKEFGVDEVVTGIGRTGVVGVIKGKTNTSGRTIGLRADMDALPIHEETGKDYASKTPGAMHACGHDGHTAMLLGAAKYLSETRNFDGTVVVIFQPAEEGAAVAGARWSRTACSTAGPSTRSTACTTGRASRWASSRSAPARSSPPPTCSRST
jgi:amidohydrolase